MNIFSYVLLGLGGVLELTGLINLIGPGRTDFWPNDRNAHIVLGTLACGIGAVLLLGGLLARL